MHPGDLHGAVRRCGQSEGKVFPAGRFPMKSPGRGLSHFGFRLFVSLRRAVMLSRASLMKRLSMASLSMEAGK